MKTKLRKEFEKFKRETQMELFLLSNPPRFKFGDSVTVTLAGTPFDAIYRGRSVIEEVQCMGDWFYHWTCFVEDGDRIITVDERNVFEKKDAKKIQKPTNEG